MRQVQANIAVAVGYCLLGLSALYLSIPPLIASPLWPAAGFATLMVMRYGYGLAPGVFLGSVAAIVIEVVLRGEPVDWSTQLPLMLLISTGAVVRSHLATWLTRRFAWMDESDRPIELWAMVLSGGAATIASATIGSFALFAVGFASTNQLPGLWFTWWLGDAVGTLAVWPMLTPFIWTQRHQNWRNWLLGTIPVLVVAAISVALFVLVRDHERAQEEELYQERGERIVQQIESNVRSTAVALDAARAFLVADPSTTLDGYDRFVTNLLGGQEVAYGIAWVVPVSEEARPAYEVARAADLGRPAFRISDSSDGSFVRSPERDEHLVVHLTAPAGPNLETLGLDTLSTGSGPTYRAAEERGHRMTTGVFRLAQEKENQQAVLIIEPVWLDQDSERPDGFLALIVRIGDLVTRSLSDADHSALRVELFAGPEPDAALIHSEGPEEGLAETFEQQMDVGLPGHHWRLRVTPTLGSAVANASLTPWIVLLTGSLTTAGLGLLFQSLNDRRTEVLVQVEQQTRALAEQNQELERARDAAEAADRAKSAFIATMSHELRTPMHGVIGMLDLLSPTLATREQRGLASTALQSAQSLLLVIGDLLDYATIEAGHNRMVREPCDVRVVADEAMSFVAAVAAGKGLDLWCLVDPSVPGSVMGDAAKLRQVLLNLVGNAVKFTSEGKVILRVSADVDRLRFEVQDTGPGIPEEQQERVFEPFYQADQGLKRSFGGTGLGLMISREMARAMGGEIRVLPSAAGARLELSIPLSDEGAEAHAPVVTPVVVAGAAPSFVESFRTIAPGHCVRVDGPGQLAAEVEAAGPEAWVFVHEDEDAWLEAARALKTGTVVLVGRSVDSVDAQSAVLRLLKPVTAPRVQALMTHEQRRDMTPDAGRPQRVLVVDDDDVSRMVAVAMLKSLGHEVRQASGGMEALDALRSAPHELILMDCQMPEMDGFETTRRIRQLGSSVPIVAVTANVGADDRAACLEAGMNEVLGKPFTREALGRCVVEFAAAQGGQC